jgi:hypothetical protein
VINKTHLKNHVISFLICFGVLALLSVKSEAQTGALPFLGYQISDAIINGDGGYMLDMKFGKQFDDGTFVSNDTVLTIGPADVAAEHKAEAAEDESSFVCGAVADGVAAASGQAMQCMDGSIQVPQPDDERLDSDKDTDSYGGTCASLGAGFTAGSCGAALLERANLYYPTVGYQFGEMQSKCHNSGTVLRFHANLPYSSPQTMGNFTSLTPIQKCVENPNAAYVPPIPEIDTTVTDEDINTAVAQAASGPHVRAFQASSPPSGGSGGVNNQQAQIKLAGQAIEQEFNDSGASPSAPPAGFSIATAPSDFSEQAGDSEVPSTGGSGSGSGSGSGGGDVTVNVEVDVTVEGSNFCEDNPNVLMCADIDLDPDLTGFEEIPIQSEVRDIAFDVVVLQTNNTCPNPDTLTVGSLDVQINMQPFCDGLVYISPLVRLIFAFSALMIVTGGTRSRS